MLTPDKLNLVLVTWKDANSGGDDAIDLETVASYHKPTIVHTLGWLLHEDEEGITIVNEFYDHTYRGRTFIYRPMLVSIVPFKLSKPRTSKQVSPTPPT